MEIKSLPVQNEDGDLVPGASATVYHMDSGDLATIYDKDGAVISNPITAGADGIIEFAAENGPYRVILTIGVQQYERFLYFSDIKEHNHSPSAHPELSAFITSEADRAEQAADAAAASGNIYSDTAAGLAATTEGDYFSVPSAEDDEYLILYRHAAGPAATEVKRYPSAAAVGGLLSAPVVTSWARPTSAVDAPLRTFDLNVRAYINLRFGQWYDDNNVPLPTPAFVLDEVATAPRFAFSMARRLFSSYAGSLFRVSRTIDSATLDCSSALEAESFGANHVVGMFDQRDGTLYPFASPLAYQTTNGFACARNNTGVLTGIYSVGNTQFLSAKTGAAVFCTFSTDDNYSFAATNQYFFLASTYLTQDQVRMGMMIDTGGFLSLATRHEDGEAAVTSRYYKVFGGLVSAGFCVDYTDATAAMYLNGKTARSISPYGGGGTGPTDSRNSSRVRLSVPANSTLYEMVMWDTHLSTEEHELLAADQVAAWGAFHEVRDGATSWWCDPVASQNGRTVMGFSTSVGQFCISEYDNVSRALLNTRFLEEPIFSRDDHNEVSVRFMDDGALVVGVVGHMNSTVGSGYNGRIACYYSESGRIADLGDAIEVTSTLAGVNYCEWLEGQKRLVLLTNDDPTVAWVPLYSADKDMSNFVQGRPIFRQGALPGEGQNQVYTRARMVSPTDARMVCNPHPSNAQNALRLVEANVDSGHVWIDSAKNSLGKFDEAGTSIITMAGMPSIYTPPIGYSCRLLDVSPDGSMIAIGEFLTGDGTAAVHYILRWDGLSDRFTEAAWEKIEVGAAGAAFWPDSVYCGSLVFAQESHRGLRLYRCREMGGTWYLDRMDSRNGGATWKTTQIYSSSEFVIPRCFAVDGGDDHLPVIGLIGEYTTYTNWRLRPLVA